MKILHCTVENFASYKKLEFSFDNQGLTLISGPTGSGKSTLCDVIPWILFGRTSKGGAVDEVRAWGVSETTEGELLVDLGDRSLRVYRSRKPNDLQYVITDQHKKTVTIGGVVSRGKDINDTQKIINELLGFDYELYMSGAYFHEFSTTASFFTATAKVRRQITEQLVDLSLAKKLVDRTSEYKKDVKGEITRIQNELNVNEGVLKSLTNTLQSDRKQDTDWHAKKDIKLSDLKTKADDYKNHHAKQLNKALKEHKKIQTELEDELLELEKGIRPETDLVFYRASILEHKKQLELTKGAKCPACGNIKSHKDKALMLARQEHELDLMERNNDSFKRSMQFKIKDLQRHNDNEVNIKSSSDKENPYVNQLKELKEETSPFTKSIEKRVKESVELQETVHAGKLALKEFTQEFDDLELLLDVTDTFRAALVKNTVIDLETNTNKILNDYFDSEIQVKYELNESDKLETTITKDGNECVFTQLSKGQRQLLKLSFAVSVMKCVSNHHGVHFNAIFMDESFEGLSEQLKVQSYALLEKLASEHSSVFVVEHSQELKALFLKRYEVTLTAEGSELGEA